MSRIPYKWIVAIVFVAGTFMDILDTTSVNVALPTLAQEFDASISQIEWVVLGYLLSLAVWIPASGWIGDRFGTKKVYLFALVVFTGASMLCGVAGSLAQLNAFRILQGVGGGMLVPVGTAMLFRAFPPIERAKASTVLIVPTVLAPALGPVVGGWFVTYHSWRWIFYLNLPVGIITFFIGLFGLKEHKEPHAGKFDLPGFVLSGAGLAAILFALSRGPSDGWAAPIVLIPLIGGLLAFALLVYVEAHVEEPMLALRLLKERMFRNANVVTGLAFGSFAGLLFILPLFLQTLLGLSAIQSGLTTFPQAVGMILASQVAGRLYHSVGPRRLVIGGLIAMTIVTLPLATVGFGTSLWTIRLIMFARGLCMAFAFVPIQASSYANIQPQDTGRASAIYSAQRQISASLGVAILATVLAEAIAHYAGSPSNPAGALDAYQLTFFVAALLIAVAAASAFLIRDRDAASTIRRLAEADDFVVEDPAPLPYEERSERR
ncbi:MAG: DHA2 family efflux MFS transporter permease subunit [Actinobacteria bacterium]|nr:DHA2 family efflux MFS transporter permease subunit [Actinomycetota bacterium]